MVKHHWDHENLFQILVVNYQGSQRNSKTQFHDFSMIFNDQQCDFHDYLMTASNLPPLLTAFHHAEHKCGMQKQKCI